MARWGRRDILTNEIIYQKLGGFKNQFLFVVKSDL